jgi:hypothetical protein
MKMRTVCLVVLSLLVVPILAATIFYGWLGFALAVGIECSIASIISFWCFVLAPWLKEEAEIGQFLRK